MSNDMQWYRSNRPQNKKSIRCREKKMKRNPEYLMERHDRKLKREKEKEKGNTNRVG